MNVVKEINWERTTLILKTDQLDKNTEYYLSCDKINIPIKTNNNCIKVSFTNVDKNGMLPSGKWVIKSDKEIIRIDKKIIEDLKDHTRIFRYSPVYSYIVETSTDDNFSFILNSDFVMKNRNPQKNHPLIESNNLKDYIKNVFKIIAYKIVNIYYRLICLFKEKRNVLFLTENSNTLSGNLKVFFDYLSKKDEYKISVFSDNLFAGGNNILKRLSEINKIASAKYIILDNYASILTYLNVSSSTKVVQLWHAGLGFKAVGYARFGQIGSPKPFLSGHRKYDLAIVDQEKLIPIYEEVFGINKEKIKACGMPRMELFFNSNHIKETVDRLYKNNKILSEKKIILFAPTYRGVGQEDAYYDMNMINQKELYDFCQKNGFIVIFKFHPFTNNKITIKNEYKNYLFDYDNENINDLLYISDILITDYSSVAYEFSLLKRPIIFYRYDKEIYEYTRGIHTLDHFFNDNNQATSFEELLNILEKYKKIQKSDVSKFIDKKENKEICKTVEKAIFR